LDDLYSQTKYKSFNFTKWGVGNVSMLDVLLQHRHLKEDMIASYVHDTTVSCFNSGVNTNNGGLIYAFIFVIVVTVYFTLTRTTR